VTSAAFRTAAMKAMKSWHRCVKIDYGYAPERQAKSAFGTQGALALHP